MAYNDWWQWIPIALKPDERCQAELKYCRENDIQIRIMRYRENGKEWVRLFRRSEETKIVGFCM